MSWHAIAIVALSLTLSWLGCFVMRRWAPAWGLVNAPEALGGRKTHAAPTPLGGGLAIGLSVLATLALLDHVAPCGRLLVGAAAMLVLGLCDDRWRLAWKIRLAVELLVAALLVFDGAWRAGATWDAPLVILTLAATWIVLQLNAINMLDNMDGLAAGVAAIAAAFLAALILAEPHDALGANPRQGIDAAAPLALVGALIGFLWHNRPPARLFMGDAGSYFAGFLLGTASSLATMAATDRPWPARIAPMCVLAVPLYDMVSVVAIRLATGRSPFAADRNHISHRLVAQGLGQRQAVLAIQALTCVTGVASLVVASRSAAIGWTTLVSLAIALALAGAGEFLMRRKHSTRE